MTISNNKINDIIADSIEDGVSKDDIIVGLFTDHAVSLNQASKAVAKYMKDNGLTTVRVGFTQEYYDWLVDADPAKPRTKAEATKFMKEHGSENTLRHERAWQHQRVLVERAFQKALES